MGKKPTRAERVFDDMRNLIQEVYPDDDEEAWQWQDEAYETHNIERPVHDFRDWYAQNFQSSDPFTQHFIRRLFTMWDEMMEKGFQANNLTLYPHQKALFAWIALTTREDISSLLVRSPYGSGKSLVAGVTVCAFREMQEELIAGGSDPKTIPTGALLGLRKEHMLQNALGQQYAVLQPPYTVERSDVNVYYKNLATMFGEPFTKHFVRPSGKKHPFYDLFSIEEDADDPLSPDARIDRYLEAMDAERKTSWERVSKKARERLLDTLRALIDGKIVFIPDVYNVPQPETPLPREESVMNAESRYRGDSAYALSESGTYRVKATHKHLALDRTSYTTDPNAEHPSQFCIAYGSMLTRAPENIRADIREEIMKRGRLLFIDEAGAYTPYSLGDSMNELSGEWPKIVGFTGQDRGIDGWTRSPVLSIRQMIASGLMKPIAFMGIGDARNPPEQGSEEAWVAYRKHMFQNEKTASTLHLPQPHELDTVVIAPPGQLREYAHRILQAHEEEGKFVKVWCFDPQAGDSRWSIVVNGFNAPKQEGDPRRILVAPPSQMAEALHLHAECYDILTNMNRFAIDQACGRLGHIRNLSGTKNEQEKARTCFRIQWLEGASGEAYIREVAKKMGYALKEEGGTWIPLQCMIDWHAHERDRTRTKLSPPQPIPDSKAIRMRKKRSRKTVQAPSTPLGSTSPYVLERERKRAEREAKLELGERLTEETEGTIPMRRSFPSQQQKITVTGLKKSQNVFFVSQGKTQIFIVVEEDGMPSNLHNLATEFSVESYYGSLSAKVRAELEAGIRGGELAKTVLSELLRLQEVVSARAIRSEQASNMLDTSDKYIDVRIHPRGKPFPK